MFLFSSVLRGFRSAASIVVCLCLLIALQIGCSAQPQVQSPAVSDYSAKISQIVPQKWPAFDIYCTVSQKVNPTPQEPDGLHLLSYDVLKGKLFPGPQDHTWPFKHKEPNQPVYCLLLVDKSGSMDEMIRPGITKRMALMKAIDAFTAQMRPQDECAILAFGTTVPTIEDIKFFHKSDTAEIDRQKNAINTHFESTRLYDCISTALDYISQKKRQARTAVLVMTDGVNNIRHLTKDPSHNGELLPDARLEDLDITKETDEARPGRKAVIDKALTLGIHLDTVGFGDRKRPVPDKSSPDYIKDMEDYLDTNTVQTLAEKTKGHYRITDDPDELRDFYAARMNEYKLEQVISCQGNPDQLQDSDPGIYVEYKPNPQSTVKSNTVQTAYLVASAPPIGNPLYGEYVMRRVTTFVGLFAVVLLAWILPRFISSAFGSGAASISSQEVMQRATNQQNPNAGYWQSQASGVPSQISQPTPQPNPPAALSWQNQASGHPLPGSQATAYPGSPAVPTFSATGSSYPPMPGANPNPGYPSMPTANPNPGYASVPAANPNVPYAPMPGAYPNPGYPLAPVANPNVPYAAMPGANPNLPYAPMPGANPNLPYAPMPGANPNPGYPPMPGGRSAVPLPSLAPTGISSVGDWGQAPGGQQGAATHADWQNHAVVNSLAVTPVPTSDWAQAPESLPGTPQNPYQPGKP